MVHLLKITLLLVLLISTLPSMARAQPCGEIENRVNMAQQWIINAQRPSGLFTYDYFPLQNRFSEDDNIVRQVSTFWALSESLTFNKSEEAIKTIGKFREKINSLTVRSIVKDENGRKNIAFIKFRGFGKVNTPAVYILGLISLKKHGIRLTNTEKRNLAFFARGIRGMADEKGGFWYFYHMPKEQNEITPYGSGEALFALAKYYDFINDRAGLKWTYNAFLKYFDRFLKEKKFQTTQVRSFFTWGIYALATINKTIPIDYHETVKPMISAAFKERANNPACHDKGCISSINLGEASFFEGILQAYEMALKYEKNKEEIKKIKTFIDLALQNYMNMQITDIKKFREETGYMGTDKDMMGAFCKGIPCERIRNDLTQHAASSLMYYHKQMCP